MADDPPSNFVYFGILKAGGVVVPMNVLLKAPEVEFHLSYSEAKFLIAWEDFAGEALRGARGFGLTTYVALRPGRDALPEGTRNFGELLQGPPRPEIIATAPEATAVFLCTPGPTGRPKGAELSHFNLYMCCEVGSTRLVSYQDDEVA